MLIKMYFDSSYARHIVIVFSVCPSVGHTLTSCRNGSTSSSNQRRGVAQEL